ncbi:hypothetical protein Tco_0927533 [Tanacetum coccineum]
MEDAKLALRVTMSSPTDSISSGGGGTTAGGGDGSGDSGSGDGDTGSGDSDTDSSDGGEGDLGLLRDKDGKSDGGGEDDDGKSNGVEYDYGKSDGSDVGISFLGRRAKAELVGRGRVGGLMGKVVISSSESDDEKRNKYSGTWCNSRKRCGTSISLKRRLFETPGLVESSSLEFDLFSDIKEHLEEEETAEIMTETMEKYMSKTHENYGGLKLEDANEHIEKVLEIVDLFHIPEVTQDQIMLRAFPMSLTGAASRWLRNEPSEMEEINNFLQEPDESLFRAWERFKELLMKCPQHYLTDMHEVILFYNMLDVLTRQILDSKGVIPTKTVTDAKVAIQKMVEYSQKWHNGTSSKTRSTKTSNGLAAIQAQLNSLRREIKKVNEKVYAAQVGYELCKGPHYTKDYPLKKEGKNLKEAYYTQFGTPYQPGGQYRAAGQDSTNTTMEILCTMVEDKL